MGKIGEISYKKQSVRFKETAREIDADQPSDAFDRVVEEMARPISYDSEKKK